MTESVEPSEILSREQLFYFFDQFATSISLPVSASCFTATKQRLKDAIHGGKGAVAVTTCIQEEILSEMGIDPRLRVAFLGKVKTVYENNQELIIKFCEFVAKEEQACNEAELDPDVFANKMHAKRELKKQQLEMLKIMRTFNQDEQLIILKHLQEKMIHANFDASAAILTSEEIKEIVTKGC